MKKVINFLFREDGATSIEYAVMLALIIIVCIGAVSLVGGETANFWGNNRQELENAFGP
jgi:pilus assembly protein Flp/PilA